MAEMPTISIVDAMIDVERWLSLSAFFKPLSGNESKIKNYSPRFIATSLSYGCNLGPTQTERCLIKFSSQAGFAGNFLSLQEFSLYKATSIIKSQTSQTCPWNNNE